MMKYERAFLTAIESFWIRFSARNKLEIDILIGLWMKLKEEQNS